MRGRGCLTRQRGASSSPVRHLLAGGALRVTRVQAHHRGATVTRHARPSWIVADGWVVEATLADSHEHKPKCTWPITLTKEYTRWANQQALTQLGKAGFRLAQVVPTDSAASILEAVIV